MMKREVREAYSWCPTGKRIVRLTVEGKVTGGWISGKVLSCSYQCEDASFCFVGQQVLLSLVPPQDPPDLTGIILSVNDRLSRLEEKVYWVEKLLLAILGVYLSTFIGQIILRLVGLI